MFKTIQAENLFAWEHLIYEVKSGISQIVGFNYDDNTSEGSGKSSIPNILSWVLFGGIPKSAKLDEIIRDGTKGGKGSVVLDSGYSVVRSRSPNDLFISTPDGKIVKGKDARETQVLIEKLIGLGFEAFCQTIYFSQNYPKKFVASNETDKAAILSEVQDLTIFDKGRKKVQETAKRVEAEINVLETSKLRTEGYINTLNSNAKIFSQTIDRFDSEKQERLKDLKAKMAKLVNRIDLLTTTVEAYDKVDVKAENEQFKEMIRELADKKVEFSTTIKMADAIRQANQRLDDGIQDLSNRIERNDKKFLQLGKTLKSGPDLCPTCGGPMSASHMKAHNDRIQAESQELTELGYDLRAKREALHVELKKAKQVPSVDEARKMLADIDVETKSLTEARSALLAEDMRMGGFKRELHEKMEESKELKTAITKVKALNCDKEAESLHKIDQELDLRNAELADIGQKLKLGKLKLSNLEILKNGFKEVKQYVFQSLLKELSKKSTKLAAELFEVPVKIEFSNQDDEGGVAKIKTLVTLDGCERSLGLYSGGQYRRIELAVDLALASIVGSRSQNPINLRILDEPMKDLSEASMEKVVKLLEKLEGSTIIIEHNSIAKSIIHNTFNIEYRNGVSHASENLEM